MATDTVTKSTLVSGAILAVFGLAAILWLIPAHVAGANADNGGVTPGFMPRVAAWSMIVLGGGVALNALRVGLGRIPVIAQESEENETLQFGRNEIEDSLIIAALATLYVVGLVKLGFLVPSAILLGIAMYCTGYRRLLPIVGISIGFPALLEYLLWYVLKVPLPQFPLIVF